MLWSIWVFFLVDRYKDIGRSIMEYQNLHIDKKKKTDLKRNKFSKCSLFMTNICRPLLAPQINHPCQDTVFVRSPICMLILFFHHQGWQKKRQLIGYLRNGTISISFMVLIMHLAWRVKRQHKWVDGIWVFNVLLFLDGLFKPTLPIDCVLKIHKCDVSIVLSIKQAGLIKYLSFEKKTPWLTCHIYIK